MQAQVMNEEKLCMQSCGEICKEIEALNLLVEWVDRKKNEIDVTLHFISFQKYSISNKGVNVP